MPAGPTVLAADLELLDGSVRRVVRRVGDGSIITRFERTPPPREPENVVCPHFLEFEWATGCPYDCAWCYLEGTLRFMPQKARPRLKDLARVEQHARRFLEAVDWYSELLNAGELADSLMWEGNGSGSFGPYRFCRANPHRNHGRVQPEQRTCGTPGQ